VTGKDEMTTPTNDDVLAAFDTVGGQVVQPMALKLALEKRGFDVTGVVLAINRAIAEEVLGQKPNGGLFLRTLLRPAGR
jgi:hypothetical protein